MFTGIIETTGTVVARRGSVLAVKPAVRLRTVRRGESVAVDGVCLTAEGGGDGALSFRLLPETMRTSTLGKLRVGDRVNLEQALRVGDRLGGHLLLGHVDGRGRVESCERRRGSLTLRIGVPSRLAPFLVPKGPIAVDGVSLTLDPSVPGLGDTLVPGTPGFRIGVHLVAHTLQATTLGDKRAGQEVNLEVDLVAKYLRGMLW
jgi:riboflavin synthase alpha subunit